MEDFLKITEIWLVFFFPAYTVALAMCHLSYSTCLTPGSVEPREAAAGI